MSERKIISEISTKKKINDEVNSQLSNENEEDGREKAYGFSISATQLENIMGRYKERGSDFRDLKYFRNQSFLDEHQYGAYYSEDGSVYALEIVGSYITDGETDANFTHGHFYECKNNGASIGWFEADVMDAPENTFYGTWDEWSNLSQTERDKYEFLDIHGDDETVNFGKYIEVVKILPMPTEAYDGVCKLYDGENESDLVKGTIYECVEVLPSTTPKTYNWTAISTAEVPTATINEPGIVKPDNVTIKVDSEGTISLKQKTFYGTMAEWEALTPEEQNTYEFMDIHGDDVFCFYG
jgi:hypothetical protein